MFLLVFCLATASAFSQKSVAFTCQCGFLSAKVMAIIPLPVPKSSKRQGFFLNKSSAILAKMA
jgi:hypothetical protein